MSTQPNGPTEVGHKAYMSRNPRGLLADKRDSLPWSITGRATGFEPATSCSQRIEADATGRYENPQN